MPVEVLTREELEKLIEEKFKKLLSETNLPSAAIRAGLVVGRVDDFSNRDKTRESVPSV